MADKKQDRKLEEKLVALARSKGAAFLRMKGVTSVGVGYRETDGKPTDELCIQVTVERKVAPERLEEAGLTLLPEVIQADDGTVVKVDVVQRSYKPGYRVVSELEHEALEDEADPHEQRRTRLDPVVPGISVANRRETAGTVGAIVYDQETGEPYVLSNWHVLHGPEGRIQDPVVQPGPFDNADLDGNHLGRLIRSHLGLAGDCAIASIEGREFREEILELDRAPKRVAKVNLGDRVVKSGRTTAVTHGVVHRIGVTVKIDYGGSVGVQEIGGFEVRPNSDKPADRGEISMGGDSGSLWVVDTEGEDKDVAVGLHFAGETDPDPAAEHALACNLHSVFEKLGVSFEDRNAEFVDDEQLWNEVMARLSLLEQRLALQQGASKACSCRGEANGKALTPQYDDMVRAPEALPIYGRWCGPGHGGGTPIDDLDAACMRHDRCYSRKGYFDCGCDADLIRDISTAVATGNVRPQGRVMGPIIAAWFKAQPCAYHLGKIPIPGGTGGTATAVSLVGTGVKSVVKGGKKLWKKVKGLF